MSFKGWSNTRSHQQRDEVVLMIFFEIRFRYLGSTLTGKTPLWTRSHIKYYGVATGILPDLHVWAHTRENSVCSGEAFQSVASSRHATACHFALNNQFNQWSPRDIPLLVISFSITNSTIPSINLATNTCHDLRRYVKARQWKQGEQEESLHQRWNLWSDGYSSKPINNFKSEHVPCTCIFITQSKTRRP